MYPKDTASPRNLYARVVKAADGTGITSGVAAYHIQGTTRGAGGGTLTHIDGGLWRYLPTQAETNYDAFAIEFYHADAVAGGPVVNVVTTTHVAQTGDSYAVVNHTDYGNAKLVRSTTPANTLSVDANNKVAVPDNQKVDLHTIKTQAVTAAAGVTFPASIGTSTFAATDEVDIGKVKGAAVSGVADFRATGFSTLTTGDIDARLAAWGKTGFALHATTGWGGAALPTIGTSTLTAQQVWEHATRTLSANTNLGLPESWPASWPANWNWSTYAGADTAGTTRLLGLVEDSDGDRFTAKALEQAPAGTGGGDDAAAVYTYFTTESRADAFKADATAANQAAALAVLNKLGFTADGDNWRVNSQVLGMANNVITSSAIATDAINSGAVATSAAQEISGWVYRLPEGHAGYAATKAVMDQIAAATGGLAGSGGIETTITVQVGGNPVDGVAVWITTDAGGADVVAGTLHTNAQGQVTFMLEAGSYYAWRQKSGVNFTNPYAITVNE